MKKLEKSLKEAHTQISQLKKQLKNNQENNQSFQKNPAT